MALVSLRNSTPVSTVPPRLNVAVASSTVIPQRIFVVADLLKLGIQPALIMQKIFGASPVGIVTETVATIKTEAIADQMMQGARYVMGMIETHLAGAVQANQHLGMEVEFMPGNVSRDEAYRKLAAAFEAAGYRTTLTMAESDFDFSGKVGFYPFVYETITAPDGRTADTGLLLSPAGIVVPVIEGPHNATVFLAKASTYVGALQEAYVEIAQRLGLAAESVGQYAVRSHLIMAKDSSDDMFKMKVALNPKGTATLRSMNGEFLSLVDKSLQGFEMTIHATSIEEVIQYLHANVTGKVFARKTEKITGLIVAGVGDNKPFTFVYEADPQLELRAPKLKASEITAILPVFQFLAQEGFEGTTAANYVGIHTHGEIQYETIRSGGRAFTVAPMLNLLREFVRHHADMFAIFPTHPNRQLFNQAMAPELMAQVMAADYVSDPTEIKTIFRVFADVVRGTVYKYGAFNFDNFISTASTAIIQYLGLAHGHMFTDGAYQFRVSHTEGQLPQLHCVYPDGREANLIRELKTQQINTGELRFFDAVLDPAYALQVMEFSAAFMYGGSLADDQKIAALQEASLRGSVQAQQLLERVTMEQAVLRTPLERGRHLRMNILGK